MSYFWDFENPLSYRNRMGQYRTKKEVDFIGSYLTNKTKILDIGGGSGRFAIPLHEAGHDVTVVEKNGEAIELLKSRCSDITLIHNDFRKIEITDKYDLVISIEVLIYMSDWQDVFQKVHNLLRDNGIFIFTAVNKSSWRTIVRNIIRKKHVYTEMSTREYLQFISKNSFCLESCVGFSWIPLDVNSNSKFVDYFSYFEKIFQLQRWILQSPQLLFAIRKA